MPGITEACRWGRRKGIKRRRSTYRDSALRAVGGERKKKGRLERSSVMELVALWDFVTTLVLFQKELKFVGVGVAAGAGTIGAGAGMGYLIGQTIASIHRQPEQFEQTRTLMFLGIGLVEAFALYSLVFALLIAFVL
jgi:F-type H+-transporting ATPase subunit c